MLWWFITVGDNRFRPNAPVLSDAPVQIVPALFAHGNQDIIF